MAPSPTFAPPSASKGPGTIHLRPELRDMKIVGFEEHTTFPELLKRLPKDGRHSAQVSEVIKHPSLVYAKGRTADLGTQRLKDMDEGGIAVQLLSLGGSNNSMLLPGEEGVKLAQDINNGLKKAVDANLIRFKALAELRLHQPAEAIKELYRAVKELGWFQDLLVGKANTWIVLSMSLYSLRLKSWTSPYFYIPAFYQRPYMIHTTRYLIGHDFLRRSLLLGGAGTMKLLFTSCDYVSQVY